MIKPSIGHLIEIRQTARLFDVLGVGENACGELKAGSAPVM